MIVIRHDSIFGFTQRMVRGGHVEYIHIPNTTTNGYKKYTYRASKFYNIRPSEHPNPRVSATVAIREMTAASQ